MIQDLLLHLLLITLGDIHGGNQDLIQQILRRP